MQNLFQRTVARVFITLFALTIMPLPAMAGPPDPYLSAIEVVKATAEAVSANTPDSDGAEYLVTLVSPGGTPLSGSVYAATSRSAQVDAFYFQDAGGSWVAAGAGGRIVLADVASDSAAGTSAEPGAVLTFTLKVTSTAPGKPYFALGLHAECARACAQDAPFPWDCDSSHIIGESAFGGLAPGAGNGGADSPSSSGETKATESEPASQEAGESSLSLAFTRVSSGIWYADGKTAYRLPAKVTTGGGIHQGDAEAGVADIEVQYVLSPDGAGAALSSNLAITDEDGIAETYITATEPGTYVVRVTISDIHAARNDLAVGFLPSKPVLRFSLDRPVYTIDGIQHTAVAPPVIIGDRIFLSARDVGDALGAMVTWEPGSQSVTLWMDNAVIRVPVGGASIFANINSMSKETPVDEPAVNIDGRVYIPFRALFESLGYKVRWSEVDRAVICKG